MCVCASRINLPAQNRTLTIFNAMPLVCAKSSVGSMQVGFVMALVGVPVKELLDDVGYWWRTRVPRACQRAASLKKRCYQQLFQYRYFAGIRFAGLSVFRSVSFPPFFVSFSPFFLKRGAELLKKGATAPFLIPNCTDRVFRRYRYGKYREIPTDTDQKIPIWYTTLLSIV